MFHVVMHLSNYELLLKIELILKVGYFNFSFLSYFQISKIVNKQSQVKIAKFLIYLTENR